MSLVLRLPGSLWKKHFRVQRHPWISYRWKCWRCGATGEDEFHGSLSERAVLSALHERHGRLLEPNMPIARYGCLGRRESAISFIR